MNVALRTRGWVGAKIWEYKVNCYGGFLLLFQRGFFCAGFDSSCDLDLFFFFYLYLAELFFFFFFYEYHDIKLFVGGGCLKKLVRDRA